MAREYGKNWFTMWTDNDFCNQPVFDKLLYQVLLGQPPTLLNYAGVQPISLKRWRKAMRDHDELPTETDVKIALIRMERRRYVFTDDDTGETLIRSFIRRDEVSKQPNVMLSALRAAALVESPKLGYVLLGELAGRIALPEISGDSPKAAALRQNLKQTFEAAVNHLETLSEGLPEVLPEPFLEDFPEGLPEPFARPGETEPFPKGLPEGFATGSVVVEVEVEDSPNVGGYVGRVEDETVETDHTAANPDRNGPPPETCPKHRNDPDPPDCGACGGYRRRRACWESQAPERQADHRAAFWAEVAQCDDCDERGLVDHGNHASRCPNHNWAHHG